MTLDDQNLLQCAVSPGPIGEDRDGGKVCREVIEVSQTVRDLRCLGVRVADYQEAGRVGLRGIPATEAVGSGGDRYLPEGRMVVLEPGGRGRLPPALRRQRAQRTSPTLQSRSCNRFRTGKKGDDAYADDHQVPSVHSSLPLEKPESSRGTAQLEGPHRCLDRPDLKPTVETEEAGDRPLIDSECNHEAGETDPAG